MRNFIKLKALKIVFAFIAITLMANFAYATDSAVKIGVLAKRGTERCIEKWSPTAEYLSNKIPEKTFVIVPVDFDRTYSVIEKSEVDFILANSSFYVELESRYGVNRIATLKNKVSGEISTKFGGVIFCKKQREDIRQYGDLKGKTFMAVKETSFGGWRMNWRELKAAGIDPFRDFASINFGGTHDAVVYAVRDGKVDAGAVRTDTLERMNAEGKISIDDFYVIHGHGGGTAHLPFLHSTREYPEWPIAKLKHTSNEVAEKVAVALIDMPEDSDAANAARCAGWTIPLNYQPVHDCLKELRAGPYKDYGKITFTSITRKYWEWMSAITILFAAVLGAAIFILKLNRNIRKTHVELQSEIVERKQAEDALRESEKNLKIVLGVSPVGIGLVVNRKQDWANETMYRMVGYEQDTLLGKSARIFYLDDKEFERVGRELYDGIKESGTGQAETRWVRKDGTVFDCIIRVNSLDPSDPAKGQIVAVTDVSELKRAHEELKESDLRHRLLVENANDAIFIVQDEVVKFPNPKTEELTGYSVEELTRTPFIEFIHPEDRNMVLDRHKRRLKKENLPSTYSFRIINRDGEELWVQLNAILITWEGRPATLNFLRDIREQKKLEAQLQRAQKMEAIGTLAGGVAHDLNNVLSAQVSYPDLILMDLPEDSPLRKPILTIQESGKKAADIVQDLLTLARRGVVATEVVNLNNIIDDYIKSPECESLKRFHPGVKSESDLEPHLLNIMGSPVHLSKTVMNLVSNAAEAMPDGGNIFISTESKYIDKPIKGYDDIKEGDYVILTVSDTGVGISSGGLERIFEPFYTKKIMGRSGTGLGMAVVWGTVKDHKGYIDVQSTEGKGTTFTLYFPVTRKETGGKEEALPMEEYMGKGESVLVVDDVEEQHEIASRILNKLGYSVTSVSSGEEAVDYLKNNSADLLVLDMIMNPGIDGLETYKRILELHPGQKTIIASGFSETDRVREAQRLGAGKYVKKPYTLGKIGLAVKEEFEK